MPRALSAHQAFYPAAALYAAVALPASVLAMTAGAGALPALADPAGHAHEMLLGFALAVVAGNQLGAVRGRSIAALHVITIGALGTLTFNVMAMSWMLRARHATAGSAAVVWGTGLIAAATGLRLLGAFQPGPWLLLAAGCWSAAFAVLLGLFWRNRLRA